MEIERKFKLPALPSEEILGQGVEVLQGYLVTEPGELRIRRKGNKAFITIKGDGTISRDEWEVEIPIWVFETLWPKTEGTRVEKIRYTLLHEGLVLEVDEYRGNLAGLVTLECEFPNEEAAATLELPAWAKDAVDVTTDPSYKNKKLALDGRLP